MTSKFTVRPGYGSEDLLIEFHAHLSEDLFQEKMIGIFANIGCKPVSIDDLIFLQYLKFESPWGAFGFERDEWGFFWVSAERNATMEALANQLEQDEGLERFEVDWSKYRKPKS